MGFFDWLYRGQERQNNLLEVQNYIKSLIEPEDNMQDMTTPKGIADAFKKADILQSIELTVKDYSKNHKVFTTSSQKQLLNIDINLKGQTFTDVYSEIVSEKIKYRVAVARKIEGKFSGASQGIECLKLNECVFNFNAVQYPSILDLKNVEYRNGTYLPEELLFFGNTSVIIDRDYGKQGIEYAVSNLINDYEAKHAIIAGRGAMGIISPATGKADAMSFGASIDATQKKELEKGFAKKYGLLKGKTQVMISSVPINYNSTSMNVQELGISDDKKENITAICSHLKYPTDLYFNATTYENQATARAAVYNSILIPYAQEDAQIISKWLKQEVEIDYSHVAELQADENIKVTRNNTVVSYCSAAVQSGLMTPEQAQKELGNYIDLENGN